MGDSLQDQLQALGLAKKKTAQPGKKRRRKPRGARTAGSDDIALEEAYRRRRQEEKHKAAEQRRQKQEQDRLRREVNAGIQAIVDRHAKNDASAELKRNFMYKGRIRSVLVTAEQLRALNAGQLGVVFLKGGYYLLDLDQVEQVRSLSPDHVPDLGGANDDEGDHPVPEDLVW